MFAIMEYFLFSLFIFHNYFKIFIVEIIIANVESHMLIAERMDACELSCGT